jgi:hypothetical protein
MEELHESLIMENLKTRFKANTIYVLRFYYYNYERVMINRYKEDSRFMISLFRPILVPWLFQLILLKLLKSMVNK